MTRNEYKQEILFYSAISEYNSPAWQVYRWINEELNTEGKLLSDIVKDGNESAEAMLEQAKVTGDPRLARGAHLLITLMEQLSLLADIELAAVYDGQYGV